MEKPSFKDAFKFWLKLGFISFGGPAGQIAIMHEYLVEKRKWISDSRFLHALNYCMILPGPEAQQLATYIGWLLHGTLGGLTAGILFILPSLFILLGLSIVYVYFGKLLWVAALFYGLKPAVIAIVVLALIKIGKKSLLSPFHYVVAGASFVCIFFFNIPFPLIIVGAILIGFTGKELVPTFFKNSVSNEASLEKEQSYYINHFSPPITKGLTITSVVGKVMIGIVLWFIPILLFNILSVDLKFWYNLSEFFTKAAFVTFGGAYSVLPYVAQVSVEKFQWLSAYEMIDGLALGETTPGPLIMVLVFVGFMAGYHHHNGSLAFGTLGLVTTAFYTFLPCFLFILVGAPWVERTKDNRNLKVVLSIVTAAVVGVILNLTIYLGKAVLFPRGLGDPDWFSIIWIITSLVVLYKYKFNMILWILISAMTGLAYQFIINS
ncbi:MAG: chromate efflux transporter [Cyclobacteriaceae bacterium]|jgi:chromate transporter|nr:chromate efflux transporter [Cyclobacteriaceae bacterium]